MATKGTARHRLSNVSTQEREADCSACGTRVRLVSAGRGRYQCRNVWRKKQKGAAHRLFVGDECENCGFKGHECQLDVDHIDGNFLNNDPSNLRTICANCHRLETYMKRQMLSRVQRGLEGNVRRPHTT